MAFTRPFPAYLSRPLIKLLEDLCIRDDVFLDLQQRAVADVEKMRTTLSSAANLLDNLTLGASATLPSTLRLLSRILKIEFAPGEAGIGDSLLSDAINLATSESLRQLKFKARIPLPGSWTLVGVADEDRYLDENTIYACVQEAGRPPIYLEGKLLISRSPWIHPGDVQVRKICCC